jgi:formate hydrogenlyase subunit 3/multisubunit Na+/H+ antiporter MnhD subunit
MGVVSNIYLIIFLPLVASLFCQIFARKSLSFWIAFISCIATFFLALKVFPDVLIYEKISNDFELSPLSIALEFRLDLLGMIFLLLLTFLKIVILFFYRTDIERALDDKSIRIFYSVFLLHLFSLVGIFTTNNLLNLFLFFEIYAFSFFATVSISRDSELLKLSFRYFCLNATSSLLILFLFFCNLPNFW